MFSPQIARTPCWGLSNGNSKVLSGTTTAVALSSRLSSSNRWHDSDASLWLSTWMCLPVHPACRTQVIRLMTVSFKCRFRGIFAQSSPRACDIHHYRYCLRSKPDIDSGRLDPAVRNPDTEGHHHAFQIDFGNHVTMGFENHSKIGTCKWRLGMRSALWFSRLLPSTD